MSPSKEGDGVLSEGLPQKISSPLRGDCLPALPICSSCKMIVLQSLNRFATAPFAQGGLLKLNAERELSLLGSLFVQALQEFHYLGSLLV